MLILNLFIEIAPSSGPISTCYSYFESTICIDYLSTVDDTNEKLPFSSYGCNSATVVALETTVIASVAVVNPYYISIL